MGPLLGLFTGLVFALAPSGLIETWERSTLDVRFRYRPDQPIHPAIVVIGIDDRDLNWYGQWPWPRSDWAEMLTRLRQLGIAPAAVVFDVLFAESEGTGGTWEQYKLQLLPAAMEGDPEAIRQLEQIAAVDEFHHHSDASFAEALAGSPTVLASYFDLGGEVSGGRIGDASRPGIPASFLDRDTFGALGIHEHVPEADGWKPPIREFAEAASGVGFVNVHKDADGVIRDTWVALRYRERLFPSLFVLAVCQYYGTPVSALRLIPDHHLLIPSPRGTRFVPVDSQGRLLINFCGGQSFLNPPHSYSYRSLVNGLMAMESGSPEYLLSETALDPRRLHGSIVLIGMYAEGAPDFGSVPTNTHYPRVAVHANAINHILMGNDLSPPERVRGWLKVWLTILFGVACGTSIRYLSPIRGGVSTIALLVLYPLLSLQLFSTLNLILPIVRPVFAIAGTFAANAALYFLVERRARRRSQAFLLNHLSKNVVEKWLQGNQELNFEPIRSKITVLFADIRGFTSLSERIQPEEVVSLLYPYFGEMVEIIYRYGGTLDKFMGDAIMAFFGQPLPYDDDAERAVRAAIDMQEKMKDLRKIWVQEGKESLGIGIGISTGEVVVGEIGTDLHREYTAIGSHVNLAFRLQGQASAGTILLAEGTYREIQEMVLAEPLEPMQMKGFSHPVQVYSLIGLKDRIAEPQEPATGDQGRRTGSAFPSLG